MSVVGLAAPGRSSPTLPMTAPMTRNENGAETDQRERRTATRL